MRRISLLARLLCFLSSVVVHAAPIGDDSFDTHISGPDGFNTFSINNLTEDSPSGGSSIPSDFPTLHSLTWVDRTRFLTAEVIYGPPGVILRNLGSTAPFPVRMLQFSDTTNFLQAASTVRLNETSPFFSVVLFPVSEPFLTAGSDLAVIDMVPVQEAASQGERIDRAFGIGGKQAKRII